MNNTTTTATTATITEIREYNSTIDEAEFKKFYTSIENKKKRTRVLHALQSKTSAKRTWQAGIVGILSFSLRSTQRSFPVVLVELLLWSAGVGFVWYKWISQEYDSKLQLRCQEIANGLKQVSQLNEKSQAWILKEGGQVIGTVALKYDEKEEEEGKIGYLTGQETKTRLQLVQHAIRFGKTNKMKVISTKWGNEQDLKWSEQAKKLL